MATKTIRFEPTNVGDEIVLDNKAKIVSDLVWSNSAPTSGFNNQTLSIDLSSYRFLFGMIAVMNSDATKYYPVLFKIGAGDQYCFVSEGNARSYRRFTPSSTGILITGAYTATFGNAVGINNNYCVPQYFYGIK